MGLSGGMSLRRLELALLLLSGNSTFAWVWFLTKMDSSIKLVLLAPGAAVPASVSCARQYPSRGAPLAGANCLPPKDGHSSEA